VAVQEQTYFPTRAAVVVVALVVVLQGAVARNLVSVMTAKVRGLVGTVANQTKKKTVATAELKLPSERVSLKRPVVGTRGAERS
jgi:hypothetical protein